MKTATQTFVSGYASTETDTALTNFAQSQEREARRYGGRDGRKGSPTLNETEMEPHIAPFTAATERECMAHLGNIKFEVHRTAYFRSKQEHEDTTKEISDKIDELKHYNEIDERELANKVKPKSLKPQTFVYVLFALFFLGETYFNGMSFENTGGSVIGDFLIGLLVTLTEGAISFFIGKLISKSQADGKKRYVWIASLALVNLGIVIGMAALRSQMIAAATDANIPAWIFFLINLAFVVASVVLGRLFFPTEKEHSDNFLLRQRFEKIDERNAEIKSLDQQFAELSKESAKQEEQYLVIKGQAEYICKVLEATYRKTVAIYKSENLRARADGMPECFKQPTPELHLMAHLNSN